MFSGTTITGYSGKVFGVHQKINRVARKSLRILLPECNFPLIKDILHFEGRNGPDAIKIKSSDKRNEPWHYYNPNDPKDEIITDMIKNHTDDLTKALRDNNQEKAAFEAAWLAHAIVDGLTPSHHYPLDKDTELARNRGTVKGKVMIKKQGESKRKLITNNWEFWGAKGVMTTHLMFELGVATTIAPLRLNKVSITQEEIDYIQKQGIMTVFKEKATEIYNLKMYESFKKKGWTNKLAKETKQALIPEMIKLVTLAWYYAARKAEI